MPSPQAADVVKLNEELLARWTSDPNAGVDDFRSIYEDFCSDLAIPEGASFENIDAGGVPCIWASGPGAATDRAVIHFHSGGYVIGSAEGYRAFGARLSTATRARVLLVHYRRAPEDTYPAAVDDALTAVRWVVSQGIPAKSIVISGDSAGGGLCLVTLQALRDEGDELPAAGIAISPWADLNLQDSATLQSNVDIDPLVKPDLLTMMAPMYAGDADVKDPRISPVFGDFKGLPPLLLMAGSLETLLDDARRATQAAKDAGVDATFVEGEGMCHIWPIFGDRLPEALQTLDEMGAFAAKHMQAGAAA